MKFFKVIQQDSSGLVYANVYNDKGKLVGMEGFGLNPFASQRRNLRKAHKWADKWIANCEKYCVDERPESLQKAKETGYA